MVGILLLFANSCFDIYDIADYRKANSSMTTKEQVKQSWNQVHVQSNSFYVYNVMSLSVWWVIQYLPIHKIEMYI